MKTTKIGTLIVGEKPVFLCSVIEDSIKKSLEEVENAFSNGADCIELRIDKLKSNEAVTELIKSVKKPSLVVCRSKNMDGYFEGTEGERIERLLKAIDSGAQAIDIELTTESVLRQKVIDSAKAKRIPVLICYENFEKTPSKEELLRILKDEEVIGADIAKFAVMANSFEDTLTVLHTVLEAKKILNVPFVAIAMGKHGSISRPLALVFGSSMTYCAVERGKEGAPGQLPVRETREIVDLLS